jgi:hypothetical protein
MNPTWIVLLAPDGLAGGPAISRARRNAPVASAENRAIAIDQRSRERAQFAANNPSFPVSFVLRNEFVLANGRRIATRFLPPCSNS